MNSDRELFSRVLKDSAPAGMWAGKGVIFMTRKLALLLIVILAAGTVAAQQATQPTIKKVPAPYTSAASGQEMYVSYCASCHGTDGKGLGPAAPAMKAPPTDLTLLARTHGGRFPADHFAAILSGKATVAAHGSQEMPVWGNVFWKMSQGHPGEVQQRVVNLSNYVASLQQK